MQKRSWSVCGVLSIALSVAQPASATQYFEELGGNPLSAATNWTNYIRLADLDGDGDLDVLVPNCGGFFGPPSAQDFRIFENDGAAGFSDATAAMLGTSVKGKFRVVAVGDIDHDGDLDVYLPNAGGELDRLYVNGGTGDFSDKAASQLPGGLSSRAAAARFGDVDGDGDLDLLVGGGYAVVDSPPVHLYLNDGSGSFSDATGQLPASTSGMDPDDIDFIDFDRDFDLDVLINTHAGKSALWLNDGTGTFSDASAKLPPPGAGASHFHYNPGICDVDGDLDLDIWIDNIGGGFKEQLLINNGGNFSDATGSQVSGNPGADDNGVVCVDIDQDGDFDAAIPSLSNNERILINNGSGQFALESPGAFPAVSDPTLWMVFGDLNGDGRLDAVTGQGEGSPARNRVYLGNSSAPVDTLAPKITALKTSIPFPFNDKAEVQFAVSDSHVTDMGARLKRAYVQLDLDDGTTEVEAHFVGGDMYWAKLPDLTGQSEVKVTFCAEDRQGNYQSDCQAGSGSGGAGQGGSGNTTTTGGATTAGQGGASSAAAGGDSGGEETADGGCGCRVASRSPGALGLWALVLLGLGWRRRRR